MKAIDWYAYLKAQREQEEAIADAQHLLVSALRCTPDYRAHGPFIESLIEQIEEPLGSGGYEKQVVLENGREATYRFSWAVATLQLVTMRRYKEVFGDVPAWVKRRHPFQIHRLCRTALEAELPLPGFPEDRFSPPQAECLRELRYKANESMGQAIRRASNRIWLDDLATMLECTKPFSIAEKKPRRTRRTKH